MYRDRRMVDDCMADVVKNRRRRRHRAGSASHSEYTVTGDTVNLAARLTGAAAAGEILTSDDTRRALAERFDCADAGTSTIKGFDEPVRAWRLSGLRTM